MVGEEYNNFLEFMVRFDMVNFGYFYALFSISITKHMETSLVT